MPARGQTRFWVALLLLVGTTVFLRSRSGAENLPPRTALDSFPTQLGDWQGRQIYIAEDIRKILGDGDFMQRVFRRSPAEPSMELFIAYFPTQRTGSTIHSPKNCLPGSGWVPVESFHVPLLRPDGKVVSVNRYVIQRGSNRQLVMYWYQAHERVVASEYWAKVYTVADAIHLNRTDGALVRVITPMMENEGSADAQKRADEFIQLILPILPEFVPR
jgi:EpsI family protein